jgi:predicted Zn-dependent peptidase
MAHGVNKTVLGNGIRVLTKKIPHVRSVSMGVWVNVGARDESSKESGLSHFVEHMIFKGTEKRTAFQIAKEFDSIGGHTNAFTSMELTCYHAKVMDTHLETMVDILSDIFLNSQFDEKEIEKELPVILQEIAMVEDSPEEYVHTLLGSNFWGDNPLGRSILGTRENIMGFNADAIKVFFRRFYQPEQIVISVAGNIEHDSFVELIGPAFEAVKSSDQLPGRVMPEISSKNISLNHRKLELAHVCIGTKGLSITDPNRYALSLINTILGGNMSSRLFQEIRERKGLAYSVYSFLSSHVDVGMFGVYMGVSPEKVNESLELLLKELQKVKDNTISEIELRNSKEYTKGSILLSAESTDNQMVRLAQNEIHFGKFIPVEDIVTRVEAVTQEDISNLAETLLDTKLLTLTTLGTLPDRKAIENILSRF